MAFKGNNSSSRSKQINNVRENEESNLNHLSHFSEVSVRLHALAFFQCQVGFAVEEPKIQIQA